jgi:ferredoxin
MRVIVDRSKCSGIGLCELTAPSVFEVADDGQSRVLRDPSDDQRETVEEAVGNCPTEALSIER